MRISTEKSDSGKLTNPDSASIAAEFRRKPRIRRRRMIIGSGAIIFCGVIIVASLFGGGGSTSGRLQNRDSTRTDFGNDPGELDFDPLSGYRESGYPAISHASKEIVMAFTMRGVVEKILVHETDPVVPGQPLIRLKDGVQNWVVEIQRIAAEDTTPQENAERRLALAKYDVDSLEDAARRDAVSPRELVRARSDFAGAELDVRAADSAHEQAVATYRREKARLDDMTLLSSIEGFVVSVSVDEGEAVDEMQSVVQLVNVDPLWMDIAVPVQLGLRLKPGMSAVVHWRDLAQDVPTDAMVKFVLPVADPASNSIVVRIEIQNPQKIPSGLHGRVKFPEAEEAWLRSAGTAPQ